jgi:F-type H+-transporting ATPase subunit gamma
MATLKTIQKRINSVKSTGKITKAMKMVSASKLRRLQSSLLQIRPYAFHLEEILKRLSLKIETIEKYPLLMVRPVKTIEALVLTSDRGLCGSFNANTLKFAESTIKELKRDYPTVNVSVVGKKGVAYFKNLHTPMRKIWVELSGGISFAKSKERSKELVNDYLNGTFDELVIIYAEFKSALRQPIVKKTILPIRPPEIDSQTAMPFYLYEPSEEAIINGLLDKYILFSLYKILLESNTSEEAARMVAMENATKNANEMIDSLTLTYNKARQAAITKEMLDIIGGSEAIA